MRARPKIYIAAPLFSSAELQFNRELRALLSADFEVFLPQENGDLMADLLTCGLPPRVAAKKVFAQDVVAVRQSDVLVMVLDGRAIDEGAAFELGVAYAAHKTCVGLQTDIRRLAPFGNNPMIDGALESICGSPDELHRWLQVRLLESRSPGSVVAD